MYELIEEVSDIDVLDSEYARLLGFPRGRGLEGRSRELAEETRAWYRENGRPWLYLRELESMEVNEEDFVLEGARFRSQPTRKALKESTRAFVAAVSAGPECVARSQELWEQGKPDEYFFMEMFGGAVVESLIMRAGARLCAWADPRGLMALPHYSPGYPDWDVSEQVALLQLARSRAGQRFPSELDCLDSGMLRPKKALLGVFGVARSDAAATRLSELVPCESCSLPGCAYRRLPYAIASVDPAHEAGHAETVTIESSQPQPVPLDLEMRYATNQRALRKWAQERLTFSERADGAIDLQFLYEGTTCSNMGHPIRYVYDVRLDSAANEHRILEAACQPAEGDSGHAKMCEYLKRTDRFLAEIEAEKPLLGEPLESIREWDPPSSFSGCYCESSSRNHKWRIVYEVIHYALAQRYRIGQPSRESKQTTSSNL